MFRGKKYKESAKLIEAGTLYDTADAMALVVKTAPAKFDETVELHVKLGVDSRHADQQVRGAIVLPHGTGKTQRVLVFAKGDKAEAAREAGADFVGEMDMVEKIQKENWFDYQHHPLPHRQGVLRPREAGRELQRTHGRHHQGQARRCQGPVCPQLHRGLHHGPRREDQRREAGVIPGGIRYPLDTRGCASVRTGRGRPSIPPVSRHGARVEVFFRGAGPRKNGFHFLNSSIPAMCPTRT